MEKKALEVGNRPQVACLVPRESEAKARLEAVSLTEGMQQELIARRHTETPKLRKTSENAAACFFFFGGGEGKPHKNWPQACMPLA